MNKWAFVTQKGGAGKTTLATNLAVSAELRGRKTLIIDLDPQKSAVKWYSLRDSDSPAVAFVEYQDLDEALKQADKQGFEFVLIDTAGVDSNINSKAALSADFCIIPCQPTTADLQAQDTTVELMKRNNIKCSFILTRCPPVGKELEATKQGLKNFSIPIASCHISSLKDYQRAFGNGEGVVEYDSSSKAAKEINCLFDWVEKRSKREDFSYA